MYAAAHSYFSLRYGTLSEEELAGLAKRFGLPALALTDINNVTGVFPFVKACQEQGIQPLVGIEFRRNNKWLYTGLARNPEGFKELNDYLSYYTLNEKPLPDLAGNFENANIIYPLNGKKTSALKENEFIGIKPAEVPKIVLEKSKNFKEKLLVHQPLTYATRRGQELHKHLRAIDNNILLSQLQREHGLGIGEHLIQIDKLKKQYEGLSGIWQNTEKLIEDCSFSFDFEQRKNKQTFTGDRYDDKMLLEKLALDGLKNRYGLANKEAARRVRHELDIIENLNFSSYFLITWDVIRYSMSRGFYHVGRGSGANSVVAYCLHITDVDPIQLDLYFERFLNPKRTSPPDFDIDYSWDERDEVIDYIFKRYGREHTALMCAMSTFQENAAMRELGKVYGLPKSELDALVKNPDDPLIGVNDRKANINFIFGNVEAYSQESRKVTDVIAARAPLYEKASIDEHYLDLTGMDRFYGCWQWTQELRKTITKETGLPISFGLSVNKTVSKIATGQAKPNGQLQVIKDEVQPFLSPLSIRKIPGVGQKSYQLLRNMGVPTIEVLRMIPVELMQKVLGKEGGMSIWQKANGVDFTPVVPYTEQKSISTEQTFATDTTDILGLNSLLVAMTEELAFELRKQGKLAGCITVKIRYTNFDTHTQQLTIPYTASDHILIRKAKELFQKLYQRRMLIRLIGVRLSNLVQGFQQIDLFEDTTELTNLYQAMDKIRFRYGAEAVKRAIGLGGV